MTQNVEQQLPNPLPGTVINSISQFGGTLSEEERQKLEKMAEDQNKYWEQWTVDFNKNMQETMQNAFRPGFPFN